MRSRLYLQKIKIELKTKLKNDGLIKTFVAICRRVRHIIFVFARKYLVGVKAYDCTETEKIYQAIYECNQKNKSSVCIFAPPPSKTSVGDGYLQRVRAIDTSILNDCLRIYCYDDLTLCQRLSVSFPDYDHIYILFDSHSPAHRQIIFEIAQKCGIIYTHSLIRFMNDSIHEDMNKVFELPGVKRIWDVHGAVPEEHLLNNDELGFQIANDTEKFLYFHVDVIITVNHSMHNHLQQKYGASDSMIIVLPIFTEKILQKIDCFGEKTEQITVVYAGGLQKWQNVELMKDIVAQTMSNIRFKIFVPDRSAFLKLWGNRVKPTDNVVIEYKTPDQMEAEYRTCHYGMILRDDIVVNNVACPTKLVEYLQYGIVPVCKSEKIGDFAELGMHYVKHTEFVAKSLPTNAERDEIARQNYSVLNCLYATYVDGKTALLNVLSEN